MNDTSTPMRIAVFTHSLNPRGGVVHALSVAEAMQEMGHDVTLVAPRLAGERIFRDTSVATQFFPAAPVSGGLAALVRQRVEEYIDFTRTELSGFDLYHAHDGIGGYALSRLRQAGEIPAFARTVHHLDAFSDPFLNTAQDQSIESADVLLCVSRVWAEQLEARYGREAPIVRNGVDLRRFCSIPAPQDLVLCEPITGRLEGPIVLCVGGVERRKNTLASLEAFLEARPELPRGSRLVIAGGASLLDHSDYRQAFDAALAAAADSTSVRVVGRVADNVLPALYRRASILLFPSIVEGFGLAVLEAMACGTPVVTSRIPPFTEYLTETDAVLVDPLNISSIAAGIQSAMRTDVRDQLIPRGQSVARRHTWAACAERYIDAYKELLIQEGARRA